MTTTPRHVQDRFLGIPIRPLTRRRLLVFRSNRRGFISLWVFLTLFVLSLFAEFIANDKPLLVRYDGEFYFPVFKAYPETDFGGEFATEAEYRDPFVEELIEEKGWIIWPLVPFSYRTINYDLESPAPTPPSLENVLGTDDQARDVVARLIYGFRISVVFGLTLTIFATILGVAAGAVQGYFGGWVDLVFQRLLEIWGSMPTLYVLIIMSSMIVPGFWPLLIIMLLFNWTAFVGVVRAEFLRARNLDYVRAARALGQPDRVIMFKHILPNAMVATVTMLPFVVSGNVTLLSGLDFLGFGMPPGSPSLGELVQQGKSNLQAPWLGFTAFFALAIMLSLLVFMGEALRDAVNPRKTVGPLVVRRAAAKTKTAAPASTKAAAE